MTLAALYVEIAFWYLVISLIGIQTAVLSNPPERGELPLECEP